MQVVDVEVLEQREVVRHEGHVGDQILMRVDHQRRVLSERHQVLEVQRGTSASGFARWCGRPFAVLGTGGFGGAPAGCADAGPARKVIARTLAAVTECFIMCLYLVFWLLAVLSANQERPAGSRPCIAAFCRSRTWPETDPHFE